MHYVLCIVSLDTSSLVSARLLDSSNDSQVCVECSFAPFSTDSAICTCEVEPVSGNSTLNFTQTLSNLNVINGSVEGCIRGINSSGELRVYVYGEGDVTLPEFIFYHTVQHIKPITDGTTDMTETTSDTPSNPTDSPSPTLGPRELCTYLSFI